MKLCEVLKPYDGTPDFEIRWDWQASREGAAGGLAFQTTEFEEAESLESALEKARCRVSRHTPEFNPAQWLQGALVFDNHNGKQFAVFHK